MYTSYFGFDRPPFDLTPDPSLLFWTAQHREVFCNLSYGVTGFKGLTVLTGEAGTGKTTLLRSVLEQTRDANVEAVCIDNPTLTRDEFVDFVATAFGLSRGARESKSRLLIELANDCRERHRLGSRPVLIVDEAQSLPDALLEEIRLLSNIELAAGRQLPVLLVGQPSLGDRLNSPGMRQLKQRVALRCALQPFNAADTATYIAERMRLAGGSPSVTFTTGAIALVYEGSGGIARSINVICDNALITAFADQQHQVTEQIVRAVCRDFDYPLGSTRAGLAKRGVGSTRATANSPNGKSRVQLFNHFKRRPRLSFFFSPKGLL